MDHSSRRGFLGAGIGLMAAQQASAADLKLPVRTLGKTGLKPTVLGFGCMTTSDPSVIQQGVDAGITYFDTARGYQGGQNERMVGAALKGKRDKLMLSSKTPARTPEEMVKHLETSLSELQTDHLDIWYLHSRSTPEAVPDALFDMQDKMKQQGKIRFKGVSLHSNLTKMIPWLVAKGRTDVILTSYNFTMDAEMDKVLKDASDAGVGIVAMKVMAGGFRSNKPGTPMHEKLSRQGAMAAALKWAVRNPFVHTSIPGIQDMDMLDDNFKAVAAGWKATDAPVLAAQLKAITPLYCTVCGKCGYECEKGLPHSDIIRIVSYADGYGQFGLARERWQELPEEVRAVKCSDCTACSVKCPHGVNVAGRVGLAQEWFA
ncbi:MAG: aldo/keto reductase [Bryobacteraceae bacterium]|nr:aldo/keto reductase [Bryobacteraceae bacterium]